jgi:hypothetical protein
MQTKQNFKIRVFQVETTKSIVNMKVKGIDNLELELITLKIKK